MSCQARASTPGQHSPFIFAMRCSVLIFFGILVLVHWGSRRGLFPSPLCASYCLGTFEVLDMVTFHPARACLCPIHTKWLQEDIVTIWSIPSSTKFLKSSNFRDQILLVEAHVISENFAAQQILSGSPFLNLSLPKFIEPNNEIKVICLTLFSRAQINTNQQSEESAL